MTSMEHFKLGDYFSTDGATGLCQNCENLYDVAVAEELYMPSWAVDSSTIESLCRDCREIDYMF